MLATKCSGVTTADGLGLREGSTKFYSYSSHADTDECATNNGGCEVNCINTIGSFHCSCPIGYHLDEDGFNCNGESFLIKVYLGIFLQHLSVKSCTIITPVNPHQNHKSPLLISHCLCKPYTSPYKKNLATLVQVGTAIL